MKNVHLQHSFRCPFGWKVMGIAMERKCTAVISSICFDRSFVIVETPSHDEAGLLGTLRRSTGATEAIAERIANPRCWKLRSLWWGRLLQQFDGVRTCASLAFRIRFAMTNDHDVPLFLDRDGSVSRRL